jgi:ATP-dependent DNA ligase
MPARLFAISPARRFENWCNPARRADREPSAAWQYEPKWDGFRCLVFRDEGKVERQSKSGRTRYFPELIAGLLAIKAMRFMLDAEIVVPQDGTFSFDALLQRIHPATTKLGDAKGWLENVGATLRRHHRQAPRSRNRSGDRSGMQRIKNFRSADCGVGGFRYGEGRYESHLPALFFRSEAYRPKRLAQARAHPGPGPTRVNGSSASPSLSHSVGPVANPISSPALIRR